MRAYDDYMMARMMQGVTMQGGIGRVAFMSRQVKNAVRLMMMALVAMVAIGFTSCSKDDDNNGGGGAQKMEETGSLALYFSVNDDDADLFDTTVNWYDASGQYHSQKVTPSTPVSLSFSYNMSVARKFGYEIKRVPKTENLVIGKAYSLCASSVNPTGENGIVLDCWTRVGVASSKKYNRTSKVDNKTFASVAEFEEFAKKFFRSDYQLYQRNSTSLTLIPATDAQAL